MIENKAYIVALMLLIASPIAIASDEGQAVLERFGNTSDDLVDVEKDDRTKDFDDIQKEDILNDRPIDEMDKDVIEKDCLTLEQWKESLTDHDWDKDWERETDEVREEEERDDEDDSARGGDDEDDDEHSHDDDVADDHSHDDDEADNHDHEDDGEHSHADDKADDHSHDDDEADDHNHVTDRYDENWEEIRAVMQELAQACEDGDEEACVDLREMIAEMMDDRKEKDWDQGWDKGWDRKEKDWDAAACLTMEEWKKIFGDDKDDRKDDRKGDDDRKKRGPHRDVFVREIIEDLEIACNEDDEEACEELEAMLAELEEKEGSCDKERDNDEHDEDDERNDDESDEEEQDQDDSEDDDPENA